MSMFGRVAAFQIIFISSNCKAEFIGLSILGYNRPSCCPVRESATNLFPQTDRRGEHRWKGGGQDDRLGRFTNHCFSPL